MVSQAFHAALADRPDERSEDLVGQVSSISYFSQVLFLFRVSLETTGFWIDAQVHNGEEGEYLKSRWWKVFFSWRTGDFD